MAEPTSSAERNSELAAVEPASEVTRWMLIGELKDRFASDIRPLVTDDGREIHCSQPLANSVKKAELVIAGAADGDPIRITVDDIGAGAEFREATPDNKQGDILSEVRAQEIRQLLRTAKPS